MTTGKLLPEGRGNGRVVLASKLERPEEGQGVHVSERTGFGSGDFAVGGAVLHWPRTEAAVTSRGPEVSEKEGALSMRSGHVVP